MRLTIPFVLAVLAGALLVACNSAEKSSASSPVAAASPGAQVSGDTTRRITVAEVKALLDKNEAVIIDVRNEGAYNQSHIKGAKLIPANEVLRRIGELPRDKTIVTYCS